MRANWGHHSWINAIKRKKKEERRLNLHDDKMKIKALGESPNAFFIAKSLNSQSIIRLEFTVVLKIAGIPQYEEKSTVNC